MTRFLVLAAALGLGLSLGFISARIDLFCVKPRPVFCANQ